jgi:hypothetical protein
VVVVVGLTNLVNFIIKILQICNFKIDDFIVHKFEIFKKIKICKKTNEF